MSFLKCPKCGNEALEIKKDESVDDYYICVKCGHIFKEASMSKKELKFGQWAWVWNNNEKDKCRRIYVGFDGRCYWAVSNNDEGLFLKDGTASVTIVRWKHAEPYKPEIDWNKVPRDTKVLVSNDGFSYKEAYFAGVFGGLSSTPYGVFWRSFSLCSQKDATGVEFFKYCRFPEDFEIPEEWLKDDGC